MILQYLKECICNQIIEVMQVLSFQIHGKLEKFSVVQVRGACFDKPPEKKEEEESAAKKYLVTKKTILKIVDSEALQVQPASEEAKSLQSPPVKQVEEIAGLEVYEEQLVSYLKLNLFNWHTFEKSGIQLVKVSSAGGTESSSAALPKLSFHLSISLSLHHSLHLSISLSLHLSFHLSISLLPPPAREFPLARQFVATTHLWRGCCCVGTGSDLHAQGIMLVGQSGCGKSALMRKLSRSFEKVTFIFVEAQRLLNRVVGESEKKIENYFAQARQQKPSVLFFDDIHIVCGKKDANAGSVIQTINNEIDKLVQEDQTLVVAATSNPKKLDESLKRAGRFDKQIQIDIPKASERLKIFRLYLNKAHHQLTEAEVAELNFQMNGFTGADIASLLRESIINAVDVSKEIVAEDIVVNKQHIEKALEEIQPSGIKEILMDIPKVPETDPRREGNASALLIKGSELGELRLLLSPAANINFPFARARFTGRTSEDTET